MRTWHESWTVETKRAHLNKLVDEEARLAKVFAAAGQVSEVLKSLKSMREALDELLEIAS